MGNVVFESFEEVMIAISVVTNNLHLLQTSSGKALNEASKELQEIPEQLRISLQALAKIKNKTIKKLVPVELIPIVSQFSAICKSIQNSPHAATAEEADIKDEISKAIPKTAEQNKQKEEFEEELQQHEPIQKSPQVMSAELVAQLFFDAAAKEISKPTKTALDLIDRYRFELDEFYPRLLVELTEALKIIPTSDIRNELLKLLKTAETADKNATLIALNEIIAKISAIIDIDLAAKTPAKDAEQYQELALECLKLRSHLELRLNVDIWEENAKNSKTPIETLHKQIQETGVAMSNALPYAHDKTNNVLNRALLEADGLREFKELMQQSRKLRFMLAMSKKAGTSSRWWRILMNEKESKCHKQLMKAASELGQTMTYLMDLTELDEWQTREAFSTKWFLLHSNEIATSSNFLQKTAKGFELTAAGILHIQNDILKDVLTPDNIEVAMPKEIKETDLVLLAHYLGRAQMLELCRKYALYGDGTDDHPFNVDNLRAVLVGMAASRDPNDLLQFPPEHRPVLSKLLDDVTLLSSSANSTFGRSPRMLKAFNNRAQNAMPTSLSMKKGLFYAFRRWAREYSYSVVDSSPERYRASFLMQLNLPMFIAVSAVFTMLTHTKMDNDPARQYYADLAILQAQKPINAETFLPKGAPTPDESIAAIMLNLQNATSYEEFVELYPMFSEENYNKQKVAVLKEYQQKYHKHLKNKAEVREPSKDAALAIIDSKVKTVGLLKRGEILSHNLAYKNIRGKENVVYELTDRNLNPMKFQAKCIVPPESGLGVNFFRPAEGQPLNETGIVPLIITLPGTHNLPGVLRDLDGEAPGSNFWAGDHNKRKKIAEAINKEIGELKQRYGQDARISIEIFGHSLGGSDALQMELLLMEFMVQNMQKTDPQKINDYRAKIGEIFTPKDKERLNNLKYTLFLDQDEKAELKDLRYRRKTQKRMLKGLERALSDNKNIKLDPPNDEHPNNVTTANIDSISYFGNRSAGASLENTFEECSCMGLLATGEDKKKKTKFTQHCVDVEGDPLRLTTADRFGAYYVDFKLAIFNGLQNMISINDVYVKTGKGFEDAGWAINAGASNDLAPLDAHVGNIFVGNHMMADAVMTNPSEVDVDSPEYDEELAKHKKGLSGEQFTSIVHTSKFYVTGPKVALAYALLAFRIVAEYGAKKPFIQGIPTLIRWTFGTRKKDEFYTFEEAASIALETTDISNAAFASWAVGETEYDATFKTTAELLREKRDRLNIKKEGFNKAIGREHAASKIARRQYTEADVDKPQVPAKEVTTIPTLELISNEEELFKHIDHQRKKAKQYLSNWTKRFDLIEAELLEMEKTKQQIDSQLSTSGTLQVDEIQNFQKQSIHLENEIRRLTVERDRLKTEIRIQAELCADLDLCCKPEAEADIGQNKLHQTNCVEFLRKHLMADDESKDTHQKDANRKTLSLEAKALIPLTMFMQKQQLNAKKTNRKEQGGGLLNYKSITQSSEEAELQKNITVYENFLRQENILSSNVMGSRWLFKQSNDPKINTSGYLELDDDGVTYKITEAGLKRLETLFNIAIGSPIDNRKLTTEELALLGHYFGRRCVKKVMDRYSLKGDGSDKYPFSMDNLRALMIGAVLFDDPEYLRNATPEHLAHVAKSRRIITEAATDQDKQFGTFKRMSDNFMNYEQNELAVSFKDDPRKYIRAMGRGVRRGLNASVAAFINFISRVGSAGLMSSPLTGNTTPIKLVAGSSGASAFLSLLAADNPSAANFGADLAQLQAMQQMKKVFNNEGLATVAKADREIDVTVDKMLADLNTLDADEFLTKYKGLDQNRPQIENYIAKKPQSASDQQQMKVLLNNYLIVEDMLKQLMNPKDEDMVEFLKNFPMYANEKEKLKIYKDENLERLARDFLTKRVTQINDWGRSEAIARLYSQAPYSKNSVNISDKDGKILACQMRSVTDTGVPGLRFNCFWPKDDKSADGTIPLMITIPEDIDTVNILSYFSAFTRWAAQYTAGHRKLEDGATSLADRRSDKIRRASSNIERQSFKGILDSQRKESAKRKIIKAVSDEIGEIKKHHGDDAQISIELFGQGIAASHCQHMELYIMEALAAHKYQDESKYNPNHTESTAVENLLHHQNHGKALSKSLQKAERDPMYDQTANDPGINIKLHNICGIRSYAHSDVGMDHESALKRAALTGYLAEKKTETTRGFKIIHYLFNTKGDNAPYMGADKADRYVNTELPPFKDKDIELDHVHTKSNVGMDEAFENLLMKGEFDTDKVHGYYGKFLNESRFNTDSVVTSAGNEQRAILNEQCGLDGENYTKKAGFFARKAFMGTVCNSTQTGAQGVKLATYSPPMVAISKTFRTMKVYVKMFSTKGVDADVHGDKERIAADAKKEAGLNVTRKNPRKN